MDRFLIVFVLGGSRPGSMEGIVLMLLQVVPYAVTSAVSVTVTVLGAWLYVRARVRDSEALVEIYQRQGAPLLTVAGSTAPSRAAASAVRRLFDGIDQIDDRGGRLLPAHTVQVVDAGSPFDPTEGGDGDDDPPDAGGVDPVEEMSLLARVRAVVSRWAGPHQRIQVHYAGRHWLVA